MLSKSGQRRARLLLPIAVFALGCTTSAKDVREARKSGYMTDFAVVYGAALAATQDLYPTINESATRQLISTAWHPLQLSTGTVTDSQTNVNTNNPNASGVSAAQRTRYFVRFRVYILGGKPFRVRIEGEASEWTAGEVPSPLKGAEVPAWLGARTDSLRVAIHKRLKEHAVPIEKVEPTKRVVKGAPLPDEKSFGTVPAGAAKVIARVSQAADGRDLEGLKKHLAANLVWAKGSMGAEAAAAIWAADPSRLAALSQVLNAGCAERGAEVACPPAAAAGEHQGDVARFRVVDGDWKLTSFFTE